jgi:cellulose synthase/poly-beta-1,6-N-acetylglucosamine synthase-like glycosyltransferase
MLQTFAGNPQIEIIHKENGGKHTALNLAIAQATTPFIGCLDADSYAAPDALTRLMRRFHDVRVMAVVPSLHIYNAQTIIQKLQKVEYLIGVFIRTILAELNALYVTPGPFSIFRTAVFAEIGPYRKAHNTEDMEMALRLQSHGMKIASAHDAVVYTSSPHTIPKLYRQRVRWTSGFLHNVKDYRTLLFKPAAGHIGGFILPFMLVSTGCVFFVVTTLIYDLISSAHETYVHFSALGVHALEWSWPTFNWFYMHTNPILLIGIIMICTIFAFIFIGTKLSRGNRPNLIDIACYTFLYSFIAPFWVIRSVANVTFNKQASWR